MSEETLFADILLPLPLKGLFTYRVPRALKEQIKSGQRAVVPFGRRRVYAGLIRHIHTHPPQGMQARYIYSLLDRDQVVTPTQFAFWQWIASYYMCTEGEVMNAALPPAMKLAGEMIIMLNPDFQWDDQPVNEQEYSLITALKNKKSLRLSEAAQISGLSNVLPLIKGLIERGGVMLKEDLENPWRPRMENFVRLGRDYLSEEAIKALLDQLEKRAPRQMELLMGYLHLAGPRLYENLTSLATEKPCEEETKETVPEILQSTLTARVKGGSAALQSLVKKGALEICRRKQSRFTHRKADAAPLQLNEYQQQAFDELQQTFEKHQVVLLHGVTGSGKTEIYIKMIQEVIARGQQVLYLLPEIALTSQIIDRLQAHFGERAGIYHSRFNPIERTEVWNNLLPGGLEGRGSHTAYDLVLGPRSAMFLPFQQLGLVIVDEEHDPGFKQHDPAPRYHARDAAIYLAQMHGARVLLGTATPSVETYYHARSGKFGLVELLKRYGGMMLPEIFVSDIKKETRQKSMKSHFSLMLYEQMKETLEAGRQLILFQNRRGFSLRLACDQCEWTPQCHQCDVSLVYHKKDNLLKCHYCGFVSDPPQECPQCHHTGIRMKGFGTEKIEEELPLFFPDMPAARLDLDTSRSRRAYQEILSDFEQGRIRILVGTQMVSKGLDFDNVGLVGILNADNMLGFPDFRSHERAYQLMAQVSGRAGRSRQRGKVIIQTWQPWHSVIRQVIDNDYAGLYSDQIVERRKYHYPPFSRLIRLTLMHTAAEALHPAAEELARRFRALFNKQVFGPEYPPVGRIRNQYLKQIMIKLAKSPQLARDKQAIQSLLDDFQKTSLAKGIRVVVDVDPV